MCVHLRGPPGTSARLHPLTGAPRSRSSTPTGAGPQLPPLSSLRSVLSELSHLGGDEPSINAAGTTGGPRSLATTRPGGALLLLLQKSRSH